MSDLDLPAEPYGFDLPHGVRATIPPVTAAVMAATRSAAARRLAAIRISDPDLDPDMSRGLSLAFRVKALDDIAAVWNRAPAPTGRSWTRRAGLKGVG